MRALAFAKYEGLGNDFVVIDVADEGVVDPHEAARLCDRRLGVGADGVLLVLPPRGAGASARMRVLNADGSIAEMCGNGLRCVALHLGERTGVRELLVETDAGTRRCVLDGDVVTVDMGDVRSLGMRQVDVDGQSVELWLADAGNPHAVRFGAVSRGEIDRLGPRLATAPSFPEGVNVGFANIRHDGIDLVVWERGVGVTLACGTGACAAVAVACARELVPSGVPIDVRLPGGILTITHTHEGASHRTTMRGPVHRVFTGKLGPSRDHR